MIRPLQSSHGVYIVEFTVVMTFFMLILFGLFEFGRLMYLMNTVANATRMGARYAVVCDMAAVSTIKTKMMAKVPNLTANQIAINYSPTGCTATSCESVTVSVENFTTSLSLPAQFALGAITVPSFSTTSVRESMDSANNALCS